MFSNSHIFSLIGAPCSTLSRVPRRLWLALSTASHDRSAFRPAFISSYSSFKFHILPVILRTLSNSVSISRTFLFSSLTLVLNKFISVFILAVSLLYSCSLSSISCIYDRRVLGEASSPWRTGAIITSALSPPVNNFFFWRFKVGLRCFAVFSCSKKTTKPFNASPCHK